VAHRCTHQCSQFASAFGVDPDMCRLPAPTVTDVNDPDVWSGRALQAESDDKRVHEAHPALSSIRQICAVRKSIFPYHCP
jgi:hypothetical protein